MSAIIEMKNKEVIFLENDQYFNLGNNGQSLSVFTYKGGTWVGHIMEGKDYHSGGIVKIKPVGCYLFGDSWVQVSHGGDPVTIINGFE